MAYGLIGTVDYILEPDSSVLRIDLTLENPGTTDLSLTSATLLSLGGTMELYRYPTSELSVGPLSLGLGIPWLVATDGDDALAFAVEAGNLALRGSVASTSPSTRTRLWPIPSRCRRVIRDPVHLSGSERRMVPRPPDRHASSSGAGPGLTYALRPGRVWSRLPTHAWA